ncbi:endogenous retrovirus group S71 member 1 Env polyprotein-like [Phyllostomus discolor]|uniref:Endogenous retrovirus group S71 member 1 Env polyprotein-like n=1 Tax=Phyllostomus discolor TaxID=89673 RepID=A0A6J2MMP7_9CHIR|nr:endogenous retrovirus group S71 member 1 Env polyprotein-like [Phyllostomus discolor]
MNDLSNWQHPSLPFSPCDNAIKNYALRYAQHYGCPEPPPKQSPPCGGFKDYYCKQWGCETLANGWVPGGGTDKHVTLFHDFSKGPNNRDCLANKCNPVTITILHPGDPEWIKGRTWGVRLYVSGDDPGTFFTVRKLPTNNRPLLKGLGSGLPPRPVGPVVSPPGGTKQPKGESPLNQNKTDTPSPSLEEPEHNLPFYSPSPSIDRPHHRETDTLDLLGKVFPFFNNTQPDITESCWLCLSPRPPFFVGLGANTSVRWALAPTLVSLTNTLNPNQLNCSFDNSLTLAEFHGRGTCYLLGNSTSDKSDYEDYCLNRETLLHNPKSPTVTKAPEGIWFVCTQGICKCIYPAQPKLCVSAYIIPQVYLYGGNPEFLVTPPRLAKQVPLLIPIVATIGVIGSAAVGTAAFVQGETNLRQLSQTFTKDISLLQDQVIYLGCQVDSLAEVTLPNRRGLDLLFLRQDGLCAALGEECCFYANHSGVVRENIKELTKRLKDREKEENPGWYASMFKTSTWLTTLISTIAGPLLLLLLAITLGPIILNKILAYIKQRVEVVKLMVLSQPYTILPGGEESMV